MNNLKYKQALPLRMKIDMTKRRIREFVEELGEQHVYVSYSGGKDSEVLVHIAREIYPNIKVVFSNTGMEFPETVKQVLKRKKEWNLDIVKPKMTFTEVWDKYGIPIVSKEQSQYLYQVKTSKSQSVIDRRINGDSKGRFKISKKWQFLIKEDIKISDKCCAKLKKDPLKRYEKKTGRSPIVGTMVDESMGRLQAYLRTGCNSFEGRTMSKPMSIWTEADVWEYIKLNNLEINEMYTKHGADRTGCWGCLYGVHMEQRDTGTNRISKLKHTHPKLYNFLMEKMNYRYIMKELLKVDL